MRLGIFGGTFDPIHLGHLTLAECCLQQARLDVLWFMPTAQQPLKPNGPYADGSHRLAMVRLAIEPYPEFEVSTIELDRGATSYSIETLEHIQQLCPAAKLFFPMGADSLAELPRWHRAADVCQLAIPLVVRRAGCPPPNFEPLSKLVTQTRLEQIQSSQVEMPAVPISSTGLREQIAAGAPWQDAVPEKVADYIRQHQLYQSDR